MKTSYGMMVCILLMEKKWGKYHDSYVFFLVFGTHYSQNFVFSCVVISIIFFIIININKSLVFGTHEMNLRCLLSKMVRVGKIKKSKSPSPSILFPWSKSRFVKSTRIKYTIIVLMLDFTKIYPNSESDVSKKSNIIEITISQQYNKLLL